ncbi:MAG: hypothetical protein JEZ00_09605 [Anaerolineaceae bacterium]|nr:hypothetical protein [Anaerolineaceae bacterium]
MQDDNNTSTSLYPQVQLLNIKTKEIINIEDYFNLLKTTPLSSNLNSDNFVIFENNTRNVYLLDPEKMILTDLNITSLDNVEISQLKYSPDEQFIIYTVISKTSDPSLNSFLYDVKTEKITKAGNEIGNCYDISWSATGDFFSVLCDISTDGWNPEYHVYVYDFSERNINSIQLLEDFPRSSQPTWSSGDDLLVMLTKISGNREFLVFDIQNRTKEFFALENKELLVFEMKLIPNAKGIIYISGEDVAQSKIYKIDFRSTKTTVITAKEANYQNLNIVEKH